MKPYTWTHFLLNINILLGNIFTISFQSGEALDPRLKDTNPYNDDDQDFLDHRPSLQKTINIVSRPDVNSDVSEEEILTLGDLNIPAPMYYTNFEVTTEQQACFVEIKPDIGHGKTINKKHFVYNIYIYIYILFQLIDSGNDDTNRKYIVMIGFEEFPNITTGPWDNDFTAVAEQEVACSECILYIFKF